MELKLELFKTYSDEELTLLGNFDEDTLLVYGLLTKGFVKKEILAYPKMTPRVFEKSVKEIEAVFADQRLNRHSKFQQLLWINSGQLLSQCIAEQNLIIDFENTKSNFILNFTPAQTVVIKLYLNGYSKKELASLLGVKETAVSDHLRDFKECFSTEISNKESSWLSDIEFSFQSLVHLILLCQYAKGSLDTSYRHNEINQNSTALSQSNPEVFRPIFTNLEIQNKLKHLRNIHH